MAARRAAEREMLAFPPSTTTSTVIHDVIDEVCRWPGVVRTGSSQAVGAMA